MVIIMINNDIDNYNKDNDTYDDTTHDTFALASPPAIIAGTLALDCC